MNKKKSSVFWKPSDEDFIDLIKRSKSKKEVVEHFGMVIASGNYKTLNKRIKELNIDTSHFIPSYLGLIKCGQLKRIPDKEVFVENSSYDRCGIKKRIIKQELIPYECSLCDIKNKWKEKELVLILDHINGVNNDNRIENLRFVCPNCNSQLDTHCGKNKAVKNRCEDCGKIITKKSKRCITCSSKKIGVKQRKFNPSKIELETKIKELNGNLSAVGRFYKVSDNAIRKRIKKIKCPCCIVVKYA